MKSPMAIVKESFGDKKKLVEAVEKFTGEELWVGRTNQNKGLAHVSNAKLMRLHATFSSVKEKFGTRFKLIDAIVELEKRTKDEGYRSRLLAYPVPRLWDMYKSAAKRRGVTDAAAGEAPKPKKKAAPPPKEVKAERGSSPASRRGSAAKAAASKTAAKKAPKKAAAKK
jgi:hypothetical protein